MKHAWGIAILCLLILLLAGQGWALTLKIEGTTNVEDAHIQGGLNANKNYGGAATGSVKSTGPTHFLIRVQNLSSLLPANATITAFVCSAYCTDNTEDATIAAYRNFKPWVEGDEDGVDDDDGDVTYNDWASDEFEWGTAGCACANDDGVDNNQDGTCDASGRDRKATAEDTENVTTVNTWYAWSVTAALAQGWYDGTINEEGIILPYATAGNNTFATTENATAANRPFWTITYHTPGGRRNREIRSKLRGGIDEEDFDLRCRLDPADYR